MNKQLTEGKRLVNDAINNYSTERLTDHVLKCVNYHLPHKLAEIYNHIEKLEAENDKLKDALNLIIKQFPVDYDIRITEIAKEALKGT